MKSRTYLSLDGLWRFSPDPAARGEIEGFWRSDFDARLWREVKVPSCFEAGGGSLDFYVGVCWYRRAFRVSPSLRSARVVLRFEGVNYRAKVWLNGQLLGENHDGFLPFEFQIQDQLHWSDLNFLVVAVDNAHHAGDVPGMHVGWRGYGGILREVTLYTTSFCYIKQFQVLGEPVARGGRLKCHVVVGNGSRQRVESFLEVRLADRQGAKTLLTLGPQSLALEAGATSEIDLEGLLPEANAWSPDTPVLYSATALLRDNRGVVDAVETRCGFRRVQAQASGLFLNGKQIFLTGFNRHEDSPRTAMAADLETARWDLEQMKAAGANFVRLCHYPHHPAELDLCDEIGLLAFCEIPLYFWNDVAEGRSTNQAREQSARRQLERMIARDFNHPSVIFWSVSNETNEDADPAVAESNRALIRRARELDPSRLAVHVSCQWRNHPYFDEDDVICVNYYPSVQWANRKPWPTGPHRQALEAARHDLEKLHRLYPSKPVLITEFGYCSLAGTFGHAYGEDEHARVIKEEAAWFEQPFVCGATLWCWADHPWPPGRFVNSLGFSPYGVLSRERRKLRPFWAARSLFRSRQGLAAEAPATGATAAASAGDAIFMLREHLNDIPEAPFPEGYGVRPMTPADIGLWTDIQRDAEPYLKMTENVFLDEFGADLEAIKWRCFIVTDPRGVGIGTVSAWYDRDFRGRDYGRIHWLALRPACQGRGLGKAALAHALICLAQWHEHCYLATSTARLTAVALYLNFGFEPDLTPANAGAVWRDLAKRLNHPALEKRLRQK